ncbi:hypothetical protein [Maridesulfovibrio hydrothermalis]|uniref:Uncharacterized protein n=1 Tax=Maridesulfovibrio hydrothermalis AM13 = DSM 14728 TaxID=1121451 RepID=L0R7Q6_9BACT|nr:hypothetical protein [Maridesulfovibrio hydrothermalis]CCO22257.1 conserved protein of unknown function [Maridesulfovibrio hydrothermalis AM13 = DSM 14728]
MTQQKENVVREVLRKMAGKNANLNPGKLQNRIMRLTGLDTVSIKVAMQALLDKKEIEAVGWDSTNCMPLGKMSLSLKPLPVEPHVHSWQQAVSGSSLDTKAKNALSNKRIAGKMKGASDDFMAELIRSLEVLIQNQDDIPEGSPLFEASARFLCGSSKMLDDLGPTLLKTIGLDVDRFSRSPRFVIVAGPPSPEAVVLIENPHSFERAIQSDSSCAYVCTYGFGLTMSHDGYGTLLLDNITIHLRHLKTLVRCGNPPKIGNLLKHPKLFFWGDLDLSGMRIYDSLHLKYPRIRLSALYGPMLKSLKEGKSHPYISAAGKGKPGQPVQHKKLGKLKDSVAQRLASICAQRAVDQEVVCEGFQELSKKSLSEDTIEKFFHETQE